MKKHLNPSCLRELRREQPGSCWNGCYPAELQGKLKICSAAGALLHTPGSFAPLPSAMGRVPPAAGEGVLLGDKVMQLEISFSLSVSESTWIMFIGFSQQLTHVSGTPLVTLLR